MTTPTQMMNDDNTVTVDIEVDHAERRLRRVLMVIGGLWLALIPVMVVAFPGVAFYHYVWLALLLANLAVWPVVLIIGAIVEVRHGLRDARVALAARKAERSLDNPADPRLALD